MFEKVIFCFPGLERVTSQVAQWELSLDTG